ncbi:MAG: carbohydrate kinase family protein [Treponema sp.]|jgi:pseudouridine kinase|nr:carbohydrate kinase family protein [Treponema sp.]
MKITVIGGLNVDIGCVSLNAVRRADSNPARVRMSAGGVGRNIAENLLRLGADTAFISAAGDDGFASFLRERMAVIGLDSSRLIVRRGMSTGLYVLILEPAGELFTAVNDMEAVESITPADLEPFKKTVTASDLAVLDANLLPETLEAAVRIAGGVPLMADAVSAEKAKRLAGILPRLAILKTNRAEAEALAGFPVDTEKNLRECCRILLGAGLGEIHITLGKDGYCCASKDGVFIQPALPVKLMDVNGAGDAYTAGAARHFCAAGREHGTPPGAPHASDAAARGLFGAACAAITSEHPGAVYDELTAEKVRERITSQKNGESNERV